MKKYAFLEEIDLILEDEGGVIYNKLTDQFFGLDYVGNFICKELQQGIDIDTIIHRISKKYNVEKEIVSNDIVDFIDSMKNKNIIMEIDSYEPC